MSPQSHPLFRALAGGVLFLLALYLLREFIPAMGWALLLAIASWNAFTALETKLSGRRTLAAALMTLVVAIGLGLPFAWVTHLVSGELHTVAAFLQKANAEGLPVPGLLPNVPVIGHTVAEYWATELAQPNRLFPLMMEKLAPHVGLAPLWLKDAGMTVLHVLIVYFFAMLVLFFSYLHGRAVAGQARGVVKRLFGDVGLPYLALLPMTLRATVIGMVVVAIGEGVVLGAAYWIAGLPSPVTLGVATAVMAIVPGGAPLSMSTASLFLYGTGHGYAALGLISWGMFQLFIVDHFIRPRLIGEGAKLPFLVVLFGLLGGLASFGLVGLFVGPTLTALAYRLWKGLAAE